MSEAAGQRQQPTDRDRSPQVECIRNKPRVKHLVSAGMQAPRDRSRSASPGGEVAWELEKMQLLHEQKKAREAMERKLAETEEALAWKLLDQQQNVTNVAEEAGPRTQIAASFTFEDHDGDTILFELESSGQLVEYVNGEEELRPVKQLEWSPEKRKLRDHGGSIPVPQGTNVNILKEMCVSSHGPQCKWLEAAPRRPNPRPPAPRRDPRPDLPRRRGACKMMFVHNGRNGLELSDRLSWSAAGNLVLK